MLHPRPRSDGSAVNIKHPSQPSDRETWHDPRAVITVVPQCRQPNQLNDIPLEPLRGRWQDIDSSGPGNAPAFQEPPYQPIPGLNRAAGAVVVEPDGRVWIVHPTNAFGGYRRTFPKGTVPAGSNLQETAQREVFEETGLQVELFSFLIDSKRTTSLTRYYLARRIAGSPADMGWESQAVSLVPLEQLLGQLNQPVDQGVAQRLLERQGEWQDWFRDRPAVPKDSRCATRHGWVTWPLTDNKVRLALNFSLDARQAERIRQGWIPHGMDDKWFAYFADNVLYWYRSWTGLEIYRLKFEPQGDGLRATQVEVSREPEEYGNTDDAEDRQLIEELTLYLAQLAPNDQLHDPFLDVMANALGTDHYLGNPQVVSGLIGNYLDLLVKHWLLVNTGQGATLDTRAENARLTAIFSGNDPAYRVIGPWNSVGQLGQVLIGAFNLDAAYCRDESLTLVLSEALAALSMAVRSILKDHLEEPARWPETVLPRLVRLRDFAASVFMGTQSVLFPDQTLVDFH